MIFNDIGRRKSKCLVLDELVDDRGFGAFHIDFNHIDLPEGMKVVGQAHAVHPDLPGAAAALKNTAGEAGGFLADKKTARALHMGKAGIVNFNSRQMVPGEVVGQELEGIGVGFESMDLGGGITELEEKDRHADIRPAIDNPGVIVRAGEIIGIVQKKVAKEIEQGPRIVAVPLEAEDILAA